MSVYRSVPSELVVYTVCICNGNVTSYVLPVFKESCSGMQISFQCKLTIKYSRIVSYRIVLYRIVSYLIHLLSFLKHTVGFYLSACAIVIISALDTTSLPKCRS